MPLVNIVLLARDALAGQVQLAYGLAAVVSTLLYAAAALGVAAKVFGTDAVLYGSPGTWSDLFRRPRKIRNAPSLPQALFCLALMFPAYFVLSNWLNQQTDTPLRAKMGLMAAITIVLFGAFPLISCRLQRVQLATAFRVGGFPWIYLIVAIMLGFSVWPLAHELVLASKFLGFELTPEIMAKVKQYLAEQREVPLVIDLATTAVTPAVFEELFFRGFLFSALRQKYSAWKTVVWSALLFGIFHVVVANMLAVERFLPTTLLGLVLGALAYKSGSIIPSIILHACHNGFLLLLAYYQNEINNWGWSVAESDHLPWQLLGGSAVVCLIATLLMLAASSGPPAKAKLAADRGS